MRRRNRKTKAYPVGRKSPAELYDRERAFNRADRSAPPRLGVSFSGGGNRSAAFSIGVMRGVHQSGLLRKIDVMSAVSGGSYAMSWFLMQPFYHVLQPDDPGFDLKHIHDEMFDLDGPHQQYLIKNAKPMEIKNSVDAVIEGGISLIFTITLSNLLHWLSRLLPRRDYGNLANALSEVRVSYRKGIQRTYQVFPDESRRRSYTRLTLREAAWVMGIQMDLTRDDVPPVSFPDFTKYALAAELPSFVFNTTVRPPVPREGVSRGARIFEIGPIGCGSDSCGYLEWKATDGFGWEPGMPAGKAFSREDLLDGIVGDGLLHRASPYAALRNFNTAPAISGAAVSGTNLEDRVKRRTIQALNLGLEYVVPNPMKGKKTVNLSDGGHSENLGAYALLRRRCRTLVIVDAEHDTNYTFDGFRKLRRAAEDELKISLSVKGIDEPLAGGGKFNKAPPIMIGEARGASGYVAKIYYVKLSPAEGFLGDQQPVVEAYHKEHPMFPQEPTTDQFFEEAQFAAYRALGNAIARRLPADLAE